MKIPINLASQPFRRDRPMLVGSSVVAVLLLATLGVLISLYLTDRAQQADVRGDIARLETSIGKASAEQANLDSVLRRPENAEVLERSVFLNELLYRKGISWTKIFEDLQSVVPYNVRLIAVRPFVIGQGQVSLDMTVGAETVAPVIDLMKNLENSKVFGHVYSRTLQPPTQTDKMYRCRLSVNYAQSL